MVKVVGIDPEMVKKVTCSNCASKLEYTPSEVQKYSGKDYSGGSDGCEWIVCPQCGERVILKSW